MFMSFLFLRRLISVPRQVFTLITYHYRKSSRFNDTFANLSIFEDPPLSALRLLLPRRTSRGGSYNIGRLNSTLENLDDAVSRPSVDCLLGVTARQRRRARLVIDFASAAESDLAHSLHTKDDDSGGGGGAAYLSPLAAP